MTDEDVTADEIKVLGYVEYGLGGPNSIKKDLRQTFHKLIERGLIEKVEYYVLTSDGQSTLQGNRLD